MHVGRWLSLAIAAALLVPLVGAASSTGAAADDPPPTGSLLGLLVGLPTLLTPASPTPSPGAPGVPGTPGPTDAPTAPTGAPTPTASPADGTADTWIGIDGQQHASSTQPIVYGIPGSGEMYPSWDFDEACRAGTGFADGLAWMNRIARVIKRSGRTVLWTVPPSKTAVDRRFLDPTTVPQGGCALQGIHQQASLLDTYPGTAYMPLRKSLMADPRLTYWRTDLHWTSVGASIWVKQLAQRLSPQIARAQKWRPSTASYWGLFNQYRGLSDLETEPAIVPGPGARVITTKGMVPGPAIPPPSALVHTDQIKDLRWVTETRRPTWPGHTLLIGDSFTLAGLQLMRPLFRRGEFLWFHLNDPAKVARAVVHSNTVVLELVQAGVRTWGEQAMPELYYAIRDALRTHH